MMAFRVAPVGCCSNAITWAVLLVLRVRGRALRLAFFPALPFFVATCGPCAPTVGLRCWMAFQIRATASSRLVNFLTGTTPGRLFQISISRPAGHWGRKFAQFLRVAECFGSLCASLGLLHGGKEGDVVLRVNCERLHECPFLRSRRWNPAVDDIHHSAAPN